MKPKTCPLALLTSALFVTIGSLVHAQIPSGTTVVAFGDSLTDIGNNVNSPYTNSVRWSGMGIAGTWIQQLSVMLDYTITASSAGGTDYASGGALTSGGNVGTSMATQVSTYLASTNGKPANLASPTALYAFCGGDNDIVDQAKQKNYTTVATNAANNIMAQIQELANAGAKNILWLNMRALSLSPQYYGNTIFADAVTVFNQQWTTDMSSLMSEYPTVTFFGYDFYSLTVDCYNDPSAYDISNVTTPWKPGSSTLAYSQSSRVQGEGPDADEFMFWDGHHPTTHFDEFIAEGCYGVLEQVPDSSVRGKPHKVPSPHAS